MNNPFDYIPDSACDAAFEDLVVRLKSLSRSDSPEDKRFSREIESGKMLGVLIATDSQGESHTLYAFSGQTGDGGFYFPGFVEPVFDYLQPEGYFKRMERDISRQTIEIANYEETVFEKIKREYEIAAERCAAAISEYREKCRLSKLRRDARREEAGVDAFEETAMIRQSQYEKAELRRMKKSMSTELAPYMARSEESRRYLNDLKEKRRLDSENLQQWLFGNFRVLNARGESRSLSEIFSETPIRIPPSGAGECCAPKLLQAAYRRGWHPERIAEYWYGAPKGGELRRHGQYYPACRGKCLPVLGWMLQGLEIEPGANDNPNNKERCVPKILFENQWFCVADKPSGMLSVPGKEESVSLERWLKERYGPECKIKMAHRLDQDTSGLVLAAFGEAPYKILQALFAKREVKKTYVAILEGSPESRGIPVKGCVELPLTPDYLDRPRQIVDEENGKPAITDYEFVSITESRSRVIFYPHTGRTHQLRVHAASEKGLGMPIAGDRLYGRRSGISDRLCLHAHKIEFTFPMDGRHYVFESPAPF